MARANDGRLAYADLLRAFAALAVVVLHVTSVWFWETPVSGAAWRTFNIYDGLVRWCVPVFLMLSGMFLLDPKKEVTKPAICFKYILRILTALLFWGFLYALVDTGVLFHFTLSGALDAFLQVLRANTHYHLWFLYMLIGLYLVTPILRAFVRGASRGDFHWFFALAFLFSALLPTLLQFRPSQTVSRWVGLMEIRLVLGYVGYYVAGYYLKNFQIGRVAEFVIYLLGAAGAFVTVAGTDVLSQQAGAPMLTLYDYLTPNVCAMAVALFVLFRYVLGVSEEQGRRRGVSAVARLSFGIYLCHEFFIMLLRYFGVSTLSFLPALSVPLLSGGVFLCSFAVAWLLSKIPFVGKYIT